MMRCRVAAGYPAPPANVDQPGRRGENDLGPNTPLIGDARSRQALATPALVIDLGAFEHNLKAMARLCKKAGVALRPHAKTHKSVEIARRQIAAGAVGISVATVREAAIMVEAGLPGVTNRPL